MSRGHSITQGLPRRGEGGSRAKRDGNPPRPPAFMSFAEDLGEDLPVPVFGQYPRGFIEALLPWMRCQRSEIMHVCSGCLPPGEGIRVDIRESARPDILADGRNIPVDDSSQEAVLLDPPYTKEYARRLYGVDYATPASLLREACRIVRPGGRVGFVHFIVPAVPRGLRRLKVFGLSVGPNMAIRAVTIMQKEPQGLGLE